jgi:hypothetical protein
MTIRAGGGFEPVDVVLWSEDGEPNFTTRLITRSRQIAIQALQVEAEALEDDGSVETTDANVDLLARIVDELVVPVEGKGKASTIISRKWKADEVTLPEILELIKALTEQSTPT